VCVHPNFAALPETAGNMTWMYNFHESMQGHADIFYHTLDKVVSTLAAKKKIDTATAAMYANLSYNWEFRKFQWTNFLESMKDLPTTLYTTPSFSLDTTRR
jgi:hypothetical protein